jgi:hypothetical protein
MKMGNIWQHIRGFGIPGIQAGCFGEEYNILVFISKTSGIVPAISAIVN